MDVGSNCRSDRQDIESEDKRMTKYLYEYRINKKGAECFRTRDEKEARERLTALDAKRPGIYTMQTRSCRYEKPGILAHDWRGELDWTIWH